MQTIFVKGSANLCRKLFPMNYVHDSILHSGLWPLPSGENSVESLGMEELSGAHT